MTANNLLQSFHSKEVLLRMRQYGEIRKSDLLLLSANDRAYFEAEISVRKAEYHELEARIPSDADEWVKKFCTCYRDLFTNPKKALKTLEEIIEQTPIILNLSLRLKFWHTHLLFMTGETVMAELRMGELRTIIPSDYFWKAEALTIIGLGHYFAGRTKDSLQAHRACQNEIDRKPDLFIQTFNAAMATRAALKLCDAKSFEFFSQKLESSLMQHNDSRYRLRHIGYRALILNQLGEHQVAEQHWTIGDSVLHETQSEFERGQYTLYRGLSLALNKDLENANHCFSNAYAELIAAGSPPEYLAELEIAKHLASIANPIHRGTSISLSFEIATSAIRHFEMLADKNDGRVKSLYLDTKLFCEELISGTLPDKHTKEFSSVVLSIIDNVSRSKSFVSGLSHFRLIPNFVESVKQTGMTESGIADAIETVLKIRPIYNEHRFELPVELESVSDSPEVKNTLDFASSLCELGKHADRLFKVEAHLKETERATHLLHDLRFFASELSRAVRTNQPLSKFENLDSKLRECLDSYLNSLKTGHTLESPSIINVSKLLNNISSITQQMTGKKFKYKGDTNSFIWASEPMLQRLLLNLIKNGIEAGTGDRPVTVDVCCSENEVSFSVRDNGQGISPGVLESILDHSQKTALTTKLDGIGLGLRSAFDCANSLRADIRLTSSSELGTCFTVALSTHYYNISNKFSPEILVIDDSKAVRDSWEAFAEINAIKLLPVSPEEAVSFLNQKQHNLKWVILDYDLKLPNCNGADLAHPVKNLGVKIALSSGYQLEELPEPVRNIPWNAILSKEPQNPDLAQSVTAANIGLRIEIKKPNLKTIRHDLKNELTPLKTVYRFLKAQHNSQEDITKKHVNLFGRSIDAMEQIIERTWRDEAL